MARAAQSCAMEEELSVALNGRGLANPNFNLPFSMIFLNCLRVSRMLGPYQEGDRPTVQSYSSGRSQCFVMFFRMSCEGLPGHTGQ